MHAEQEGLPGRWPGRRAKAGLAALDILPLLVLAVLTRSALDKPLWRDEWATWEFGDLSFSGLWRATSHVDHDLLAYYALVHVIGPAGVLAVRLLSLAGAGVAVWSTQRMARRLWGRPAGFVAALALACNPSFCALAWQARPWGLAFGCVALGTLVIVRGGNASAGLYPVGIGLGMLLEPTVALAMAGHLWWRWRAAGARAALRLGSLTMPVALVVAGWEILGWRQRAALSAAHADLGQLHTSYQAALGGTWLLCLHLVAVTVALAALVLRRGPDGARRGLLLTLALTEGTVALAWLATAVGVPMMENELLVAVPEGAALLVGWLVGYAGSESSTEPVGWPVRGVIAVVSMLVIANGVNDWRGEASSDYTWGRMDGVATALSRNARVGDRVLITQSYDAGGYMASYADATGDTRLSVLLHRQLPAGAKSAVLRRVASVTPESSHVSTVAEPAAARASRIWAVHLASYPLDEARLLSLFPRRCVITALGGVAAYEIGDTELDLFQCSH